jgi:hypothetical protein
MSSVSRLQDKSAARQTIFNPSSLGLAYDVDLKTHARKDILKIIMVHTILGRGRCDAR